MRRSLTPRFWSCATVGLGGLAVALATRTLEPAAIAAPFLMVLLASVADGWWPPVTLAGVSVGAERVVEGDDVTFTFELEADGSRPWVELEVQFPAILEPVGPSRFVLGVERRRRVAVTANARRWGAAGPEWAVITTRDRFGVSELTARHPVTVTVRIHPPSERLNSLVPLYQDRTVTGEHRSRRIGPGSELAEVRAYRPGDPVRAIHPGLTARRGTPMVLERHPDRSSDIVLLVDSAQDLGVDLDTTLRWTVTAATALADRHLQAHDRVGVLDVGRGVRWLPARLGRRHLHTVVDLLLATEVQALRGDDHVFVVPSGLPRSAGIVAISPLLTELVLGALVALRSRGHEVLVIKPEMPEPEAAVSDLARRVFRAGNELNERWLLERGAAVVPWSKGDPLEHVIRQVVQNLGRARQRL